MSPNLKCCLACFSKLAAESLSLLKSVLLIIKIFSISYYLFSCSWSKWIQIIPTVHKWSLGQVAFKWQPLARVLSLSHSRYVKKLIYCLLVSLTFVFKLKVCSKKKINKSERITFCWRDFTIVYVYISDHKYRNMLNIFCFLLSLFWKYWFPALILHTKVYVIY